MKYEPTEHDIQIFVKIKGSNRDVNISSLEEASQQSLIDPKLIIQVFDNIENALYESDKVDVQAFFNRLSDKSRRDLPPLVEDASINRIREYRHNRLIITEANSGSIEFTAFVVAAAYLVLNNTLKHVLEDAWKKSNLHQELVKFTVETLNNKTLFIAEKLRRVFSKKRRDIDVTVLPRSNFSEPNTIEIIIYAEFKAKELPKSELTLGQAIKKGGE